MPDLSSLIMYIPGIIIFLIGTGEIRKYNRMRRPQSHRSGEVKYCKHIIEKDEQDREVFNFYQVQVDSVNPQTGKKEHLTINSPTEYNAHQNVKLYFDEVTGKPSFLTDIDERVFNPWVTAICGALLILLAFYQNKGQQIPAMICLSIIMVVAGVSLVFNYISLKKKNLQTIDGVITGTYERQISKKGRFSGAAKYTYYPIVKYELEGLESIRRCNINSSRKQSFKEGETMKLYWSPSENGIRERCPNKFLLIVGILLTVAGILAGASIVSALA
ncbi:MAG: hypothetical protein K5634_00270 [Sphaerochaetaceae bacterium]|nr:hypothetical protein [Sphaerochaetaceae bacterium]